MATVGFHTLGCKVNQYDTDAMIMQFKRQGYQIVDFDDPTADVYVINTCTVTNISDRKSRQMVRRAHRKNPEAKIVVVGCFAQTSPDEAIKLPGVSFVLGTKDRSRIVELLAEKKPDLPYSLVENITHNVEFEEDSVALFEGRSRASLKIQDGCNQFCSYCRVPYARGRSRSRSVTNVLDQVKSIVDQGYQEIVLTGVHLGAFGKDLEPEYSVAKMAEAITSVSGVVRIRISSIDPNEIDQEFLEFVAYNPKVCKHLHVPLQSGTDRILAKMKRKYTTHEYKDIVTKARSLIADIGFSTDVIVGFPGEDDALFADTYQFIKQVGFSKLHVFRYSPRSGTLAATYPDPVDHRTKEFRSQQLMALSDRMALEFHQGFLHRSVEVLVESVDQRQAVGLTSQYVRVTATLPQDLVNGMEGKLINVRIQTVDARGMAGILE